MIYEGKVNGNFKDFLTAKLFSDLMKILLDTRKAAVYTPPRLKSGGVAKEETPMANTHNNPVVYDSNNPSAMVSIRHYLAGARCGQYGQSRDGNPYPPNSWEAFSWDCGWEDEQ